MAIFIPMVVEMYRRRSFLPFSHSQTHRGFSPESKELPSSSYYPIVYGKELIALILPFFFHGPHQLEPGSLDSTPKITLAASTVMNYAGDGYFISHKKVSDIAPDLPVTRNDNWY